MGRLIGSSVGFTNVSCTPSLTICSRLLTSDFHIALREASSISTADVTPKLWEMSDIVKVLEDWEGAN